MKVMSDFRKYHNIEETAPPPSQGVLIHAVFSYIADLMSRSMGIEAHQALVKELQEYKQGLPFDVR